MSSWCILSFRRACLLTFVVVVIIAVVGPAELYAQHQRAAGVFFGRSRIEKHVTWHGIADTKVRNYGFSVGAVYELGLSEMVTLVLMPQYSEVDGGGIHMSRSLGTLSEGYSTVGIPPMYAVELPVSVRAGVRAGGLNPYVAAGGLFGYSYSDEASIYREEYTDPAALPVLRMEELSTFFIGVQVGAGICADVHPDVSLMLDGSLYQHLTNPINTDLVTWKAPLRALWRFGIVIVLEGGAQ